MSKSTPPNKETFNTIKNLLLPHLENTTERSAFVRNALYGCRVVNQIDWSGSGATFTANLIHKLLDFGECEEGRPAIVLLLEELKAETGFEKHNQIDVLIEIYAPEIFKPIEAKQTIVEARQELPSSLPRSRSIDLTLSPFAWIDIPAGKVKIEGKGGSYLQTDTVFDVPAFQIAKYPITNDQYEEFQKAGGYYEEPWWTGAGLLLRRKEDWREPRFWQNEKLNSDHPVVGVSWYEAVAFCLWLSNKTGEKIMLPTEQQWQRAAQGDDGRVYPWGKLWNGTCCNNAVGIKGDGKTTSVRKYEGKGDSPYGVVDMAGNVWEWCLTNYDDGIIDITKHSEFCILRGGSWSGSDLTVFRGSNRHNGRSYYREGRDIGFRIARSI